MSFFDGKIRADLALFGSIVVSARINEFPMILGAIASVGFNKRMKKQKKKNKLNILHSDIQLRCLNIILQNETKRSFFYFIF